MKTRLVLLVTLALIASVGCSASDSGILSDAGSVKDNKEWAAWPMPNPASAGLPNPVSYTLQGETVKDNVTGLLWQRIVPAQRYEWQNAKDYCESLSLSGTTGWRLPTAIELVSIVDFTRSNPAVDPVAFPETPSVKFWSSSLLTNDYPFPWIVDFKEGPAITSAGSPGPYAVRCVWGTSVMPTEHYSTALGVVTDNATKLEWEQAIGSVALSWVDAKSYCESLNLNGTGWRLPSINELQTLVNRKKSNPSIELSEFPGTGDVYFWSSSPVVFKSIPLW